MILQRGVSSPFLFCQHDLKSLACEEKREYIFHFIQDDPALYAMD